MNNHGSQTTQNETTVPSVIRLDETVVNRIAAGEVIERPASVVKELVENAIDAGSTRIDVVTASGGKTLIKVSDNGHGMNPDNLTLAVERHCTSKLGDDLMDIRSLGFRGEALPSVGSVSRLSITSRTKKSDSAWKISVIGGKVSGPSPAALSEGTVVEVSDLFYATPARLKFLKSDRAETNAITDVFKRMALAFPHIRFSLSGDDRSTLDYPATSQFERMAQVLGKEFTENSMKIDAGREGISLEGFASVPTYHRGNALAQYFFINGRPVRDKALLGAVRGAYMDVLPKGKHPVLALFIDLEPHMVDVNVHPAKADVRFRDAGLVRGLLVGSLKQAISALEGEDGPLTSRAGASDMLKAFKLGSSIASERDASQSGSSGLSSSSGSSGLPGYQESLHPDFRLTAKARSSVQPMAQPASPHGNLAEEQSGFDITEIQSGYVAHIKESLEDSVQNTHPLGAARAQLHKNYIVSQTQKGLVIVDQHAAHERIVYESLKKGMSEGVASQLLLVPEIIDLPEEDVNRLVSFTDSFQKLGLELEAFGAGAVAVRATPALLGETNTQQLVRDLADEIAEWGTSEELEARIHHVAATMACHGSVRSGRILKPDEMNALLRQMEETPNSGQCNHGRPTFIELDLKDIERLFGR